MITRDRPEIPVQQHADIKIKKKRRTSDWGRLIEEMERQGGYVDRAVINNPHRDRGERRRPSFLKHRRPGLGWFLSRLKYSSRKVL